MEKDGWKNILDFYENFKSIALLIFYIWPCLSIVHSQVLANVQVTESIIEWDKLYREILPLFQNRNF